MSRTWKLFAVTGALAVLTGRGPVWAQTGGLTGKTTLQDGSPCVKCSVIIERQDIKGNYAVKTDKKGNYTYIGLPIGRYKITLQDPSGKTLFYITHNVELGDPTLVDFDLPKEMARVKQEQATNPEMKKQVEQQQEQEKEQKQFTGLKQIFDQGQLLYSQGKYGEAAAMFDQAAPLAKEKNLAIILSREADSYDKAKQHDKAVDAYQRAIAANPSDANLHTNLGNVYAEMGRIPEAQQEFQKSAELDPANASKAYFNLGAVMYNSGKTEEAAAAFKKATEIDPKYADAYFLEAQSLMGKATMGPDGKVVPAPGTIDALQTYLQLDPQGKYAATAQGMLQTLQGEVPTEFKNKSKKPKKG